MGPINGAKEPTRVLCEAWVEKQFFLLSLKNYELNQEMHEFFYIRPLLEEGSPVKV